MSRRAQTAAPAGGTPSEAEQPVRVLVVDDEGVYAGAIARAIERRGFACDVAHTGQDGLRLADTGHYGLVLLDHRLPDDDGLRLIPLLRTRQPGAVVIVMTAYEGIEHAVRAIRLGADDYLAKAPSVAPIVERAIEVRRRLRVRSAVADWKALPDQGLLGQGAAILRVRRQLERVARSPETTVLLIGESGVGKEVAARELHRLTYPNGGRFLAVDCAAVPATLAESVLFGHERGAFTGADRARAGIFEDARHGTLLLDEIGDTSLELQAKLLRVLESRVFQRVGATRDLPLEARVVAATNRNLADDVRQGRFRFDLYQRLTVFPIELPPLRERREDLLPLAECFKAFFAARLGVQLEPLDAEVQAALNAYDYPGNVRELKNILERAVIQAQEGRIRPSDLPERLFARPARAESPPPGAYTLDVVPGVDTLESVSRKMIARALADAAGVKSEAARLLGISRYQLLRRLGKDAEGGEPDEA